ncbi:single-stranded DNA-binding protein [Simplicispira suum]|uniref:Single-stranded DNA-binding protein n=1 Tax=Simplicispira suum TaxID=2109915 RepID=A0A2S0MW36_9BURK|nr:single-stranded DNA-binding protein [Simplicispira suum]AVO40106.1 single-stranded DNA-binding protein [Simplicispira suum]MBW7834310.1 single-stranded DNA-binding protein [Simplicispira suum]
MIDGLVAGRLHSAPGERIDKGGNGFVVAKVLAAASEGENLIVNVIAFDKEVCNALLALRDGDSLALAGSLTPRVWTDKQGNTRPSLDMVANGVLTAHHAAHRRDALDGG